MGCIRAPLFGANVQDSSNLTTAKVQEDKNIPIKNTISQSYKEVIKNFLFY